MNSPLKLVFVLTALAVGGWQFQQHVVQSRQLAALETQVANGQRELASRQAAVRDLAGTNELLLAETKITTPADARSLARARSAAAATIEGAHATAEKKQNRAYALALADKMDTPAQREEKRLLVRNEAKTKAAPWLKNLNLTPEQAEKVYDLCADHELKKFDWMIALLRGTTDVAVARQGRDSDTADFENQLRSFLGEMGYAQYQQDNEERLTKHVADVIKSADEKLADMPMNDTQREALRSLVKEMFTTTKLLGPNADEIEFFRPVNELIGENDAMVQRGLQKAAAFLSAEQIAVLNKSNAEDMERLRQDLIVKQKLYGIGFP